MLRFEKITKEEHYPIAAQWWTDWEWPVMPFSALTDKGIMVYNGDIPVFAGWLYLSNSELCFFEWIVSNKNASKEEKKGGFAYLLHIAEVIAKSYGVRYIMQMTNEQKLIDMLESNGFQATDRNCTHLIKTI